MAFFQHILYATNPDEANNHYLNAIGYVGSFLPMYPQWRNMYLENYWNFRQLWCLAFRNHSVCGYHTNNFSEACIRIFKEMAPLVEFYQPLLLQRAKFIQPSDPEHNFQRPQPEETPLIKKDDKNDQILRAVERKELFKAFWDKVNQFDCSRTGNTFQNILNKYRTIFKD